MKSKAIWMVVSVFLVVGVLVASYGCVAPTPTAKLPVRVAGDWNTTGALKSWGDLVKRGVMLAINELNEAGGIMGGRQIVLTEYDEGTSADVSIASAKKAVADGNVAVLGGCDASAILQWQSVLREAHIPYCTSGGSHRGVLDPNRFAYIGMVHPCLFPELSEIALLDWLAANRGCKTYAQIGFDLEWARDFDRVCHEVYDKPGSPLKFYGTTFFPVDQPGCELEVAKVVKELNPDIIYNDIWNTSTEVSFFETTHRLGYKGFRLIPPDCVLPDAVAEAGEAAEGVMETCLYLPNPSPASKAFDKSFMAAYGHAACSMEEQAYETASILLRAMDIAGCGGGTLEELERFAAARSLVNWPCPRGFTVNNVSKYGQVWTPELFIAVVRNGELVVEDVIKFGPFEEWDLP